MLGLAGEVAEWLKAAVSKTVNGGFVVRGFESLPLRCSRRFACKRLTAPKRAPRKGGQGSVRRSADVAAQVAARHSGVGRLGVAGNEFDEIRAQRFAFLRSASRLGVNRNCFRASRAVRAAAVAADMVVSSWRIYDRSRE